MRTIKVTLTSPVAGDASPTEAMIADDTEAANAGREARQVTDNFIAGFVEADS